jgi:YggT family protein
LLAGVEPIIRTVYLHFHQGGALVVDTIRCGAAHAFSLASGQRHFNSIDEARIATARPAPYSKKVGILSLLLDAYSLVVLVSVVVSWFGLAEDNPIVSVTRALTEPVLAPIRRLLPTGAGLDISPMVLLLGIRLLKRVLLS